MNILYNRICFQSNLHVLKKDVIMIESNHNKVREGLNVVYDSLSAARVTAVAALSLTCEYVEMHVQLVYLCWASRSILG